MIHVRGTVFVCLLAVLVGCGITKQQQSATTGSSSSSGGGTSSSGGTTAKTTPGGTVIPDSATKVSDIQKMTDWGNCSSTCAGQAGTNAIYSMNQPIASPSLSGAAIQFNVTGGTPWGDALWWKQVGGNDSAMHFMYEISFYLTDASAPQALEFNVNQNAGGSRYEYATQCDIKGSHLWRVWDHVSHWNATSAPCPAPLIGQWNHLVWEFARNAQNQVVRVAVTLNGRTYPINETFSSYAATGSGIDVAFQMDSNGIPTPWSVWVDDVNLTYW